MAAHQRRVVSGAVTAVVGIALLASCSSTTAERPGTPLAGTSAGPASASAVEPLTFAGATAALTDWERGVPTRSGLNEIDFELFSVRLIDWEQPGVTSAPVVTAELSWQFKAYDSSPASMEVSLKLRPAGTEWEVESLESPHRIPIWLREPVQAQQRGGVLVLGAEGTEFDSYLRWGTQARRDVAEWLGKPVGRLVLEVPSAASGVERALASPTGAYASMAAVTASVDGTLTPDTPVHIFVNPTVMAALDEVSAQVVITHEVVHVATGAILDSGRPIWLTEGYADYVALRHSTKSVEENAAQIIALVKAEGVPAELPGEREFSGAAGPVGAHYESAWLAVREIANSAGEAALRDFYDAGWRTENGVPKSGNSRAPGKAWRELLEGLARSR